MNVHIVSLIKLSIFRDEGGRFQKSVIIDRSLHTNK